MPFAKIVVVVLLFAIVASLFTGLRFLLKDTSESRRTMYALMVRVGLSITLILFLLLSMHFGWIQPHGVKP